RRKMKASIGHTAPISTFGFPLRGYWTCQRSAAEIQLTERRAHASKCQCPRHDKRLPLQRTPVFRLARNLANRLTKRAKGRTLTNPAFRKTSAHRLDRLRSWGAKSSC